MKLAVDLKLEVDVPEEICGCDAATRDYVWREHQDELRAAMRFTGGPVAETAPGEPSRQGGGGHDITQKLRLLDTISQVQRRHLQMEKVRCRVSGGLLVLASQRGRVCPPVYV